MKRSSKKLHGICCKSEGIDAIGKNKMLIIIKGTIQENI